jgi:hypothetical protein
MPIIEQIVFVNRATRPHIAATQTHNYRQKHLVVGQKVDTPFTTQTQRKTGTEENKNANDAKEGL